MSVVQITVAGVDVTADVVFDLTRFKSLVNGKPGEAIMRVRDLDSTYSFTEGSDWLLAIDGGAAWRGYVTQAKRTYIYPAGNVSVSGLERFWDLTGADLNILFVRRVVFDTATPTNVTGTQFPPDTADTVAITDLIDNWLDLSSDDLDTTSGVVGVGDLDPDQDTRAWSGGWYWGDAMSAIAMIPAAIYYLRPEMGSPRGTLVYCDVDVPDAPFGLSDAPNGTTTKGFREMEILLDGTSLANDVLAWGMGYGSQSPVFERAESAPSQAAHGLWQTGLIRPGVYKQGTIDRIADSVLNGSPESKRGAKADRPAVSLVTYEPGLLAGHKVLFTSNVWGFSDVIPVRQMEVTFESPTAPRYEIVLSHEIDTPWGFIDQFWPQFRLPPSAGGTTGTTTTTTVPCDDNCGIEDGFHRTVVNGWGIADSGNEWIIYGDYIYFGNPDGVRVDASGSVALGSATLIAPQDDPVGTPTLVLGDAVASALGLAADPFALELHYQVNVNDLALVYAVPSLQSGTFGGFMVSNGDPGNAYQGATNFIRWSMLSNSLGFISWQSIIERNGVAESFGPSPYVNPDTLAQLPAVEDQMYEVRFAFIPDGSPSFVTFQFKIWDPNSESEPVNWFIPGGGIGTTIGYDIFTAVEPRLQARSTTVSNVTRISNYTFFDAFVACIGMDGDPDCIDGSKTVSTLGSNWTGFGCEVATRTTAVTFTTSQSFVPTSTFVWRDGLFLLRGGDYTEGADHRTLTFAYAVLASSVVRVCYVAETALP